MKTDKELLDWLEQEAEGGALISDDFGRWAVSRMGIQSLPEGIHEHPVDLQTAFWVEAVEWKPSVREAIAAAMEGDEAGADGCE
jgi:hypothetical protein